MEKDDFKKQDDETAKEYMLRVRPLIAAGTIVELDLTPATMSKEDFNEMFRPGSLIKRIEHLQQRSDRELGILAAVEFENFYAQLIVQKLIFALGSKQAVVEKFGDFEYANGRLKVLEKSGLIDFGLANDLRVVALVRNKFSHHADIEFFHHLPQEVIDRVLKLQSEVKLHDMKFLHEQIRTRFVLKCIIAARALEIKMAEPFTA